MAEDPIQLWNEWTIQILVLLSFTLQIFLFLFARSRWRGSSGMIRILLWLAYLMADSTAIYTLGHLSINGSSGEHKLTIFWAPFLLVHLGSQDTITAYALEDNQLWPRHLLNLGVQSFGVAYVLYKHIAEIPALLGLATGFMFVIGLIKYGERIWALKCASLDNIRSSIRKYMPLPDYYLRLRPQERAEVPNEEELLLVAQAMLPLCKGAMADSPVTLFKTSHSVSEFDTYIWKWNWKATFKVVEMELSLMYDILYTKTAVIHTWYGYPFHLVSPLATVVVFILFQLSAYEDGYNRVDVAISYILLVGAFVLDMASVFSALGSTWVCHFLLRHVISSSWRSKLTHVIMSLRRRVNAAAINRGWSGSIQQFNLLHFCCRDKRKFSKKVAKMMGLEDWLNKWHYTETVVLSEDVKELVFQYVWEALKEIHDPRANYETQSPPKARYPPRVKLPCFYPEPYAHTASRRLKLTQALDFGAELQEVILTWHVFTDVFLLRSARKSATSSLEDSASSSEDVESSPKDPSSPPEDAASSPYLKAIKMLSDYMMFLVVTRPNTIPGLELRSLYKATCDSLEISRPHEYTHHLYSDESREDILARKLVYLSDHGFLANQSIILAHGISHVKLLLKLVADVGNPDKPGIISSYKDTNGAAMDKLKRLMPDLESSCGDGVFDMSKALALIFDTWVHILILASAQCSSDSHARQISQGGELTSVIWLMVQHADQFPKLPDATEDGRGDAGVL